MKTLAAFLLLMLAAVVVYAESQTVTDDMIIDQVRLKLAGDRDVGGEKIDVKSNGGTVELAGTVRKEKNRQRAERLAKKVKGVKAVVNHLQVGARST